MIRSRNGVFMLTSESIARAKCDYPYQDPRNVHHEHEDCIRIAYEWLDAQIKLKGLGTARGYALKHVIEHWGGRYVSRDDVEIAAYLHPEIRGTYPAFNLSARRVLPSFARLVGIPQANTHLSKREQLANDEYATIEK